MENQNSWIFFPTNITAYYEDENDNLNYLSEIKNQDPIKNDEINLKNFVLDFEGIKTKKIVFMIKSLRECPTWHPGAGGKAWIFLDEVIVE